MSDTLYETDKKETVLNHFYASLTLYSSRFQGELIALRTNRASIYGPNKCRRCKRWCIIMAPLPQNIIMTKNPISDIISKVLEIREFKYSQSCDVFIDNPLNYIVGNDSANVPAQIWTDDFFRLKNDFNRSSIDNIIVNYVCNHCHSKYKRKREDDDRDFLSTLTKDDMDNIVNAAGLPSKLSYSSDEIQIIRTQLEEYRVKRAFDNKLKTVTVKIWEHIIESIPDTFYCVKCI